MASKKEKIKKNGLSKIGLLFLLYNVHLSHLCKKFNRQNILTYRNIIEGKSKRIEIGPLVELCKFLNVSSDTVFDAFSPQDMCVVYIQNKDIWIDFDLYIFLRSTEIVIDEFNEDETSVFHYLNFDKISEKQFDRFGNKYLIERAKRSKLINSSRLRLINNYITQETKELLLKETYVYISNFLSPDEFEENAKPGITLRALNKMVVEYYTKELPKHGLNKDVSEYYFHGVSHHLGLDTHDVNVGNVPLTPGNVITNEPGLYIEDENIGIRIEDDLLINGTGCEVLSKDIIKNVEDIEALASR